MRCSTRFPLTVVLAGIVLLAEAGCTPSADRPADAPVASADSASLTGTVTYRERIAPSPDVELHVRLTASSSGASPLAQQTTRPDGQQVPLPFTLAYDAAAIDTATRYVVHATLSDRGDSLRWTTVTGVPVLTQGAARDSISVPVRRIPSALDRATVYTCPAADGEAFTVTVRPRPDAVTIMLPARFGDRSVAASQVPAASGARYESDEVLFWGKGTEARLEVAGQVFELCTARPLTEAEVDARARGATFRAIGQEPGWMLTITPNAQVQFTYAYGEREVTMPTPAPIEDDSARHTTYRARTDAHDLRVTIENATCTDAMSGALFPTTVTVTLDGTAYRGCGTPLD